MKYPITNYYQIIVRTGGVREWWSLPLHIFLNPSTVKFLAHYVCHAICMNPLTAKFNHVRKVNQITENVVHHSALGL